MTEGYDPLVDRDAFARSLDELRRTLPDPGDLCATDVAREVVQEAQRDRTAVVAAERSLPGGRGPGRARRGGAGGRPG